ETPPFREGLTSRRELERFFEDQREWALLRRRRAGGDPPRFSEILTIFVAILLGLPAPLPPLQILLVNLVTHILPALPPVTDSPPAIALIRDPAEPDVMRRPPRDPRDALVTWPFGQRMLVEGALLSAGVLSAYLWVVGQEGPGLRATTVAFVALVLIHPFQAMNCRSDRSGWWRLPPNGLSWIALGTLWAV